MLNPATRKATGYYLALGVTVYDVFTHGFNQWNAVALLLLAGVAGVSGLAELIHGPSKAEPAKPSAEAEEEG